MKHQVTIAIMATCGLGSAWTQDTKLIVPWLLGKRTQRDAYRFMRDLASRIKSYVQISTDGLGIYKESVKRSFKHRADYGTEVKVFGYEDSQEDERRYSPLVVKEMRRTPVLALPIRRISLRPSSSARTLICVCPCADSRA
jgi:hypothetical protein